jgi:hypothetical protein
MSDDDADADGDRTDRKAADDASTTTATLEHDCIAFNAAIESLAAAAAPLGKAVKLLLAHELKLFDSGQLVNVTHAKASSITLVAACGSAAAGRTLVYRPMGDEEVQYLVDNGALPETQPYQAIIRGHAGRSYADKFVVGAKQVDTHPSSIVEFNMPTALIDALFAIQHKAEDGALSHGLGRAAGRTVAQFNAALTNGSGWFRVVKVRRRRQ